MTTSSSFSKNLFQWGESIGDSLRSILTSSSSSFTFDEASVVNVLEKIQKFPRWYRTWWINLVKEDPVHVFIETALIAFVVYLLVFKQINNTAVAGKKGSSGSADGNLTEAEKEELIRDWKPAPLVPPRKPVEEETNAIVVHRVEGTHLLIQDNSSDGTFEQPQTRRVLNMASHDFLGLGSSEPTLKQVAQTALTTYGCGSCGPRGFYGTIDVHLDLERKIAEFCRTDDAIMYSDGASAATSTIAAFAKRGDLLVVDEGIHEALQTGVTLSRAHVVYFKHNDMNDLRRVLQKIRDTDAKIGRKPADQRRFIVVEGLYKNYGHICPVDELVAIKKQFSYRLIVDESFSFGTLGKAGRGVVEFYGQKIMEDVEIVVISLENSLGSIGGVCVGNIEVVDHQRLSGAGYCFSASAPPFVAAAAIASLAKLERSPEILDKLAENRKALYRGLRDIPKLEVTSDERSSIAFLRLADRSGLSEEEEERALSRIARQCLQEGVLIISADKVKGFLHRLPPPSLRMTVTAGHSNEEIERAVKTLRNAVNVITY